MSKNASPRATNAATSATARRGEGGLGIVGVASGVFAGGVCAAPVAGPAGKATGGRAEIVATASDVGVGAARCDEGLSTAKSVAISSAERREPAGVPGLGKGSGAETTGTASDIGAAVAVAPARARSLWQ